MLLDAFWRLYRCTHSVHASKVWPPTVLVAAQALAAPAHAHHHLVALVVGRDGRVHRGDLDARGLQGIVCSVADGQEVVIVQAE